MSIPFVSIKSYRYTLLTAKDPAAKVSFPGPFIMWLGHVTPRFCILIFCLETFLKYFYSYILISYQWKDVWPSFIFKTHLKYFQCCKKKKLILTTSWNTCLPREEPKTKIIAPHNISYQSDRNKMSQKYPFYNNIGQWKMCYCHQGSFSVSLVMLLDFLIMAGWSYLSTPVC